MLGYSRKFINQDAYSYHIQETYHNIYRPYTFGDLKSLLIKKLRHTLTLYPDDVKSKWKFLECSICNDNCTFKWVKQVLLSHLEIAKDVTKEILG